MKEDNEIKDLFNALLDLFVVTDYGIEWGFIDGLPLNKITSYEFEKQLFKYMNKDSQKKYLSNIPDDMKSEYKKLMKK